MSVSHSTFCSSCLDKYLKFSGEDGDYGYTVRYFLDNNAPAFDSIAPGMTSQMLYMWLMTQGGCFNCMRKLQDIVQRMLGREALDTANKVLGGKPDTRQRLDELKRFIDEIEQREREQQRVAAQAGV